MAQVLGDERWIVAGLQAVNRVGVSCLVRRVACRDRHVPRAQCFARLAVGLPHTPLWDVEEEAQRKQARRLRVRHDMRPELGVDDDLTIAIDVLRAMRKDDALGDADHVDRTHRENGLHLHAAAPGERREGANAHVRHGSDELNVVALEVLTGKRAIAGGKFAPAASGVRCRK